MHSSAAARLVVLSRVVFAALFILAVASRQASAEDPAKPEFDPAHAEKMQEGLDLFKSQVRKVLIDNCVECHGGGEVESGFDLATRKGLLRGGAHGPAVVAGKSADSNVVRFISHKEKPFMPAEADKLPGDQIAAVGRWIDLGAPYDKPLVENPRDPDSWVNTVVPDKARDYWAFQPLANPTPPPVKNERWVRNPIDRFVLAKLKEKGLTPNSAAPLNVLIRRAYFDLTGLPPTAADVEQRDLESVIDQLLASPHYGERWGRHWLDAARFAESHGFEQDYDRPFAYHFRDFVIEALNQDMPYDQFVRWQLAGDEFDPENPLALKATGFLGAGVFPTQITANEVERTRYDALDDMAATMGSAMLGLSVGCARCHDHKFDPIPQADYYRLLSTFTTTVRSNLDVNLEPGPYKIAKAAFDKEHQPLVDELKAFETNELPGRLAAWKGSEDCLAAKSASWVVLDLAGLRAEGGAALSRKDDGSVLVVGNNPDSDRFTFSAVTDVRNISALRIEALSDSSLPKNGPGRSPSGNFLLTDLILRAKAPGAEKVVELKPRAAGATFEQKGQAAGGVVDDNESSGWSVGTRIGEDHAAVFEFENPIANEGGLTLNFVFDFKKNKQHALGRFRISVCSADAKAVVEPGTGTPEMVRRALEQPGEKQTEKQTAALLAWYRHRDAEWQKINAVVEQHAKLEPQPKLVKMMVCSEGVTPLRHHTQGADFFAETYFLKRGDCDQKMGQASQSFLQVLMSVPEREKHWQIAPPEGSKMSYRRRSLANWITDTEYGAGHLLARAIVNRVWQHHFGRGIVATPNDFGVQGSPPTHPELLDWLACELIHEGWRLKPIHKLIMTSAAYMQSGQNDAADVKIDPENIWLWRRTPQRLEAEVIRDGMLAVSGTLDPTMFGPGTLDEGHTRRSIYFMVKRSKLVSMMQLFDQPEPLVSVGSRPSTTIAPQALAFLNSPHVRGYAHNFAKCLVPTFENSPADAVLQGYQAAIGRAPDKAELTAGVEFLAAQEKSYRASEKSDARELALTDFCQVLFGLNEFVYVE
jgi:mono/diheme cytochrome c family protein